MKLKEYLSMYLNGCCFDCVDKTIDVTVTVDYGTDLSDSYPYLQKATDELLKNINVAYLLKDGTPVCDFSGFIKKNRKLFEKFIDEMWADDTVQDVYENDTEFYFQNIQEFDNLLRGDYGENVSKQYFALFEQCK